MATTTPTTWSQLTSITREKVLPKIIDEVSYGHPLLDKLFKNAVQLDGGSTIDQVIKYKVNTLGGSYSGLETLDAAQQQTRTRAQWNWKQYAQPIVISNIDVAKNAGAGKIFDLVRQEMEEAKTDIRDKFGTDLYAAMAAGVTGNSGKNIDSLAGAIDDGSENAIYGGITRGATGVPGDENPMVDWWNANVDSSATTTLSLSAMRTMWSYCSDGSESPNMIVTTQTFKDKYEGLGTATINYISNMTSNPTNLDMGAKELSFRGIPVIADKYMDFITTATYKADMYFLNMDFIKFFTLKHPNYPTSPEGFSMTDLRRPDTQDGQLGYILWYGNLVVTKPNRQGKFSVLTA